MGRRAVLKGAAGLGLSILGTSRRSSVARATAVTATPVPGHEVGYAFNSKTKDVTLFDPATRKVLGTKPLGAVVRWLSNEQRYWDGQYIWTYDFPDNKVEAIAIEPRQIAVARTLPAGGTGPAHSLMLTADRKTAWVNVAGADYLAVFDIESGEVVDEVATGKYP